MNAVGISVEASGADALSSHEAAYASLLAFEFARTHWPLPEHDSLAIAGPFVLAKHVGVRLDAFTCYLAEVLRSAAAHEADLDESLEMLALGVAIGSSGSPRLASLGDVCVEFLAEQRPDQRGRRPVPIAEHERPIWRGLVAGLDANDRGRLEPFVLKR